MSNGGCYNEEISCCCPSDTDCSGKIITPYDKGWITGEIITPKGNVPVNSTQLNFEDMLGGWKMRWGIRQGEL